MNIEFSAPLEEYPFKMNVVRNVNDTWKPTIESCLGRNKNMRSLTFAESGTFSTDIPFACGMVARAQMICNKKMVDIVERENILDMVSEIHEMGERNEAFTVRRNTANKRGQDNANQTQLAKLRQ